MAGSSSSSWYNRITEEGSRSRCICDDCGKPCSTPWHLEQHQARWQGQCPIYSEPEQLRRKRQQRIDSTPLDLDHLAEVAFEAEQKEFKRSVRVRHTDSIGHLLYRRQISETLLADVKGYASAMILHAKRRVATILSATESVQESLRDRVCKVCLGTRQLALLHMSIAAAVVASS